MRQLKGDSRDWLLVWISLLCTENKSPAAEDATVAGGSGVENLGLQSRVEEEAFGPWMMIERQ